MCVSSQISTSSGCAANSTDASSHREHWSRRPLQMSFNPSKTVALIFHIEWLIRLEPQMRQGTGWCDVTLARRNGAKVLLSEA